MSEFDVPCWTYTLHHFPVIYTFEKSMTLAFQICMALAGLNYILGSRWQNMFSFNLKLAKSAQMENIHLHILPFWTMEWNSNLKVSYIFGKLKSCSFLRCKSLFSSVKYMFRRAFQTSVSFNTPHPVYKIAMNSRPLALNMAFGPAMATLFLKILKIEIMLESALVCHFQNWSPFFRSSKNGPFKKMATLFFWKFKNPAACWRRHRSAISKTGLGFSVSQKTAREIKHGQTYILSSFSIID